MARKVLDWATGRLGNWATGRARASQGEQGAIELQPDDVVRTRVPFDPEVNDQNEVNKQ